MQRISVLLFAAALAAPACSTGDGSGGDDVSATCGNGVCDPNETNTTCPADCTTGGDEWDQQLASRVVDFNAADCANGGPKAGILTNPGVQAQFNSNFAFRRTRWVQETFVCTKYPAEVAAAPTDVGAASPYTGVWPFSSIAGTDNGGRVNFHDTQAVICANCHSTINHIAPLFAYYDANGMYQTNIAVTTPHDGAPLAKMSDYLPTGETPARRMRHP